MVVKKSRYVRQADAWKKPIEGEPIVFKVASEEHFSTLWQHWLEEEGTSQPCTVQFKWADGKPYKNAGTCKYCDKGIKAKPRFLWDLFVDGELVTVAMNNTSHRNMQKFLADVKLSGRRIDEETYTLNPVRTDAGWIKYEFVLGTTEVNPPKVETKEAVVDDWGEPTPTETEDIAPVEDVVLTDVEKEVIREHEEQIFTREWTPDRLSMAIRNSMLSKGIETEIADKRATEITTVILSENKEKIREQL